MNFSKIEEKWQKIWERNKVNESNISKNKKKFYLIFAYPGISGYLHVGHMRGYTYADDIIRYKKLRGYNTLFPVGTHASGNIAFSFAKKIKEKDQKWIDYLLRNGCPKEKIQELTDPYKVIDFFNNIYINDYWKRFGFLADFRRFTCTANKDYQKFIEWQFYTLKEKDLLIQKPYYAPACPKCGPVAVDPSQTDISKGGNAEKIEYTLIKFKYKDMFLVAATLRPETIFGQTNIWVNPSTEYSIAKVDGEKWIISQEAVKKLKHQKDNVEVIDTIKGKDLIGEYVFAPGIEKEIIILPAFMVNPDIGTGIVTSVPSDAPADWIALEDIKKNKELIKEFNLKEKEIMNLHPISIINTPGWGPLPAKEICEKMGITSQKDEEKLEEAKRIIYKTGFFTGVMNKNCGKYSGLKVEKAKELVKEELIKNGLGDVMWDLSEEVICRCGERVFIKKINDQWFIKYSDKNLTKKSINHAKTMNIFPKDYYDQIGDVLEWFKDRAATRMGNWIGTPLPWDKKWIIEPISDSVIYPAYYIVSLYYNEKKIKLEEMNKEFFDYVFLGKGKPKNKIWKKIRQDFKYWYPLDINLGGKEHKTVHFPPFIKAHVGIFNKEDWPKGIIVNWWVIGKGENKISKSKGGADPIPNAIQKFSVDGLRLFYANSGSYNTDIEWDPENVLRYKQQIEKIINLFDKATKIKETENKLIDKWLENILNKSIKEITSYFDIYDLKKASDIIYFELYNILKWYIRRGGKNAKVIKEFLNNWVVLLSPITPHISEELNQKLGNKNLVVNSKWPKTKNVNLKYIYSETIIKNLIKDIENIKNLIKVKNVKEAIIIISDSWKYKLLKTIKKELQKSRNPKTIIEKAKKLYPNKTNEISKIVISLVKNPKKIPEEITCQKFEESYIKEAIKFLEEETKLKIKIEKAKNVKNEKAKQSLPSKPAIIIQ